MSNSPAGPLCLGSINTISMPSSCFNARTSNRSAASRVVTTAFARSRTASSLSSPAVQLELTGAHVWYAATESRAIAFSGPVGNAIMTRSLGPNGLPDEGRTNDSMNRFTVRWSTGGRLRSGDHSAGLVVEQRASSSVEHRPLSVMCAARWSPSDVVFARGGSE